MKRLASGASLYRQRVENPLKPKKTKNQILSKTEEIPNPEKPNELNP
jgi:hypothetical protein